MSDDKNGYNSSSAINLWENYVSGKEGAFRSLFEYYYSQLFGYGLKICDNSELVKDAIQDLFENLWELQDQLEHIDSPKVYLFVSFRRQVLKRIKKAEKVDGIKQAKNESYFLEFSKEELIIIDEEKFEQKEILQNALNQLSDRQREIVYLHYYHGLSYAEIEELLSINRQSVCTHMYRAMETLRSLFKNKTMRLVLTILLIPFLN